MNRLIVIFWILVLTSGSTYSQKKLNFKRELSKIRREKDIDKVRITLGKLIESESKIGRTENLITLKQRMGELMQRTGNFAEAEKNLIDSYELYKSSFERREHNFLVNLGSQKTYFDAMDELAYFYLYTGNVKKGEQLFLESRAKRDSVLPKLSVHRIQPVIGLGSVYLKKGQLDKAFDQFERARKMIKRSTSTGFDFDNLNRLYYNDMIELCFTKGKLREAREYIEQLGIASSGRMKFSSKLVRKLETARVFEMEARWYMHEGDLRKAQEYLDKANQYYPLTVTSSGVRFKIMKTQAVLFWQQKEWVKADAAFQELVLQYRQHIRSNFISMSEYEKEQFYNTLKSDFDLFNSYVVASFDRNPTGLLEQMYNNVINTKALLLNGSNQKKNKILASGDQALIQKLHEWEKAKSYLSALFFQNGSGEQIATTTAEIESLEKELNQASGLFESVENPPDWQKVKSSLKPGEAAVELIRSQMISKTNPKTDSSVYVMLVLKPEEAQPKGYIIPAGNRFERRNLAYYRNNILSKTEDRLSYDNFWQPLRKNLKGINRIYFSPDGVYNQINLNALFNTDSQKFLIDETELVYLTNTADLLITNQTGTNTTAVLVGRPHFDDATVYKGQSPEYGQRNVLSAELISFKEQEFLDLPGTEAELNIIEGTLKQQGVRVTTYLGHEAAEQNVKSVKGPSVFHIATHGFFVEDTASLVSPMIRSGLVLAGVKSRDKTNIEDGILTAYEATNLDLNLTSLVVLSACQTGLGEVRNGEGVYGLQRAIIVAGARNLLMGISKNSA